MKKHIIASLGLAVAAVVIGGCAQQAAQQSNPQAAAQPVSAPAAASPMANSQINAKRVPASSGAKSKAVSVNELAAKPSQHLGEVSLVGAVGIVTPGQGFVVIDISEYRECGGLRCITEPGTKKIPIRWTGAAPKLEQFVRVQGTLTKTAQGLTLTASQVGKA